MKNLLSLQREPQKTDTMATMTVTRKGRVKSINEIIEQVPTEKLGALENAIRMFVLMIEAQRIDETKEYAKEIARRASGVKSGKIKTRSIDKLLEEA